MQGFQQTQTGALFYRDKSRGAWQAIIRTNRRNNIYLFQNFKTNFQSKTNLRFRRIWFINVSSASSPRYRQIRHSIIEPVTFIKLGLKQHDIQSVKITVPRVFITNDRVLHGVPVHTADRSTTPILDFVWMMSGCPGRLFVISEASCQLQVSFLVSHTHTRTYIGRHTLHLV